MDAFDTYLARAGAALFLLVAMPVLAQIVPAPGSLGKPQAHTPAPANRFDNRVNTLERDPASQATRPASPSPGALYDLPPGAYVFSYPDPTGAMRNFDATVTSGNGSSVDRKSTPDRLTISFDGHDYPGVIPSNANQFASTQLVQGRPALDGNLSANGVMAGRYLTLDPRGAPRPPITFTLAPKGQSPTLSISSGAQGIPSSAAAQKELNPQPLPPKPGSVAPRPGDANALNPQPLPPKPPPPDWGSRLGDRNSINPQPLPPQPEPNWNSKRSPTGASTTAPHVSDVAARRLRAAGLDPSSPTFRTEVDARLRTFAQSFARESQVKLAKRPVADLVRPQVGKRVDLFTSNSVSSVSNRVRRPVGPAANAPALDAMLPYGFVDMQTPQGPITLPSVYIIPFRPPAEARSRVREIATLGSVEITIPACGIDSTHIAVVRSAEQMGTVYADLIEANPGTHFEDHDFALFIMLDDIVDGEFPLGAQSRHGTMTLTIDDHVAKRDWDFAALTLDTPGFALVDSAAPFLGENTFGFTAANTSFGQPTVERVNLGDQPLEGVDTFGTGIQLGAGYVATARIVAAHSIADLGADTSPDNGYRGASISIQPQSNRLQTSVKWHIGPGDSLQYEVAWTLTGPEGQRALMTLPKRGPCDS
jgi:hypothetical protein